MRHVLICIRYVAKDYSEIKEKILKLRRWSGKMGAEKLTELIVETLIEEFGDIFDYLKGDVIERPLKEFFVSSGFDGCSVNVGKDNGANRRLMRQLLWKIIEIHCGAHRSSIASHRLFQSKKGNVKLKPFKDMIDKVDAVIKYLCASQVKVSVLKELQRIQGLQEYVLLFTPKARFDYAYDTLLRFWTLLKEVIETFETLSAEKGTKGETKAKMNGFIRDLKNPLFAYKMYISIQLLKPVKFLSKLRQYNDCILPEIAKQTEEMIKKIQSRKAVENELLIGDLLKEKPIMKIEKIVNKRKGLTKTMTINLGKFKGSKENLKAAMVKYKDELGTRLVEQLRELHPEDGMESKLTGLDLINVITKENQQEEEKAWRELGRWVFEDRCVEREDGKIITFKKFPGDTEEAIQDWKIIREDVKSYAKKNLHCTYMKIEDELDGVEEDQVRDDKAEGKKSQAEIWLAMLTTFGSSYPSLRVLILLMLTIVSHTAGVERYFNKVKTLQNKKRNRMSESTAHKLITIMCFIAKEHDFDAELLEKVCISQ